MSDELIEMLYGGARNHVIVGLHVGATWPVRCVSMDRCDVAYSQIIFSSLVTPCCEDFEMYSKPSSDVE